MYYSASILIVMVLRSGFSHDTLVVKIDTHEGIFKDCTDTETNGEQVIHSLRIDRAGNCVAGAIGSLELDDLAAILVLAAVLDILGCILACAGRFLGYIVNQVMYMQNVAACKNAGDAGLEDLVDNRAVGNRVNGDTCVSGQLVLRDQTCGKKQCIAQGSDLWKEAVYRRYISLPFRGSASYRGRLPRW